MDSQKKSPPRARLTVRVGVTGHRQEGLESADIAALKSRVGHVLKEIKRLTYDVKKASGSLYTSQDPILRIMSPLAEGADMLAAEEAIENGYELQCALPFERGEYEKDFTDGISTKRYRKMLSKATAVFELDGSRNNRTFEDESYQAVGRMVLNQSDVIIAIWDGKDARGKGGTGQIVKEALLLDIPVVWIDSAPAHEVRVLTGKEYGNASSGDLSELDRRLKRLLMPKEMEDSDIRDAYFSEVQPVWTWGFVFEVFCDIFSGEKIDTRGVHVKNFESETRAQWQQSTHLPPEIPASPDFLACIEEQINGKLILHYSWADKLANYYSNVYRSSFVANFLMAGLAVFFALLTVTISSHERAWIIIELLIIILILSITGIGNWKRWHERWIDYRLLSEEIRQLRFLAPLGLTTPAFRVPAHDTHGDPRSTWVNWHFRAIVRHLGLVSARVDDDYMESYRTLLSERVIKAQIEYHERNSPRFHKIHHRIHILGSALFFLTLVAVLTDLSYPSGWLTLCAAVFPSLGAAFFGIRNQGEFEQIAKRSEAMSAKLKDIKDELDSPDFTPSYREIAFIAENTAEIISSETLDWRIVFQSKRLVLPV